MRRSPNSTAFAYELIAGGLSGPPSVLQDRLRDHLLLCFGAHKCLGELLESDDPAQNTVDSVHRSWPSVLDSLRQCYPEHKAKIETLPIVSVMAAFGAYLEQTR